MAGLQDLATSEQQKLVDYLLQRYLNMGFPIDDAELLAATPRVDYRQVERMLEAGCPPDLALQILL